MTQAKTSSSRPVAEAIAEFRSVPEILVRRLADTPQTVALKHKVGGHWKEVTWREYGEAVREILRGLQGLGIQPGDRIGLISNTRVDWVLADMAILGARAVTVPVYPNSTADDATYILSHAGVKAVFVENRALLERVRAHPERLPASVPAILFTGEASGAAEMTLDALREKGRKAEGGADPLAEAAAQLKPDDIATMVYTSGTTGQPKGAQLSHLNMVGECVGLSRVLRLSSSDFTLSFLPLAHIFARMIHVLGIYQGYATAYAESIEKVLENLREIQPTFVGSVPRVFEKVYAGFQAKLEQRSFTTRALTGWAIGVVDRICEARGEGRDPGFLDSLQAPIADKLVLKKIREAIFGKNLRFLVSGGAPLPVPIGRFFGGLGLEILEGYGLTETTAATHLNRPGKSRIGTVGPCLDGVEAKIAEDGEILVKGSVVMPGYYKNDEANKEVFADGWFKTGDIGEIDSDGFLRITDRKKELIVTSAGKNIAPQKIEGLMKTCPYIAQIMVHGDRRNYLVALIALNVPAVKERLEADGKPIPAGPLGDDPAVKKLLESEVETRNRELARYETIKKLVLTDEDFTMENGMLTPTMKLKRRKIFERYGEQLDRLYDEGEGRE